MLRAEKKITAILLAAALFACMGCGAEEESPAAESLYDEFTESVEVQETTTQEKKKEQADSFRVIYQGEESNNDIELSHCDCVYDADGVQVYAEYLYWLMVADPFPYNQYVLYIRTPQEEFQLYPVKDFLVDEEQGVLYTKIAANDGFECVKSMSLIEKSNPMMDSEKEIFNAEEAEEMLRSAYDGQALFSNITVELTEIDTDGAGLHTYGVGGAGIYCLLDRPKTEEELKQNQDGMYTVRENITEEEFLKAYEEMTGWDFYKAQDMY